MIRLPEAPPRWWPRFASATQSVAVTARIGRVLGIFIGVCFVTGLLSHYQYGPWHWLPEPAAPSWGYRFTQGLHVITGTATIPLVLLKLWSVYPKLFAWPPARSVLHALERLSIAMLVTCALLELLTGFINILDWYPWPWFFTTVHYALAYVVIGSVLLHIAVKLPLIRAGLAESLDSAPASADAGPGDRSGISRRGVLVAGGAGVGIVAVTFAGNTVPLLRPVALLAPRQPQKGPLHVPINRTARQASTKSLDVPTAARSANYRLGVHGPQPFQLTTSQIEALPSVSREIPLACVEGWSVSAHWTGPSLLSLVERAGGHAGSRVHLISLEPEGNYNNSHIFGPQLSDAILATHLNGQRITIDHGYPIRLIAPNRAGVLNTKWLKSLEIV